MPKPPVPSLPSSSPLRAHLEQPGSGKRKGKRKRKNDHGRRKRRKERGKEHPALPFPSFFLPPPFKGNRGEEREIPEKGKGKEGEGEKEGVPAPRCVPSPPFSFPRPVLTPPKKKKKKRKFGRKKGRKKIRKKAQETYIPPNLPDVPSVS